MTRAAAAAAVFAGGFVGTGLRLAVDTLLPHPDAGWPWSTLAVNVIGSFALGLLAALLLVSGRGPSWVWPALGTGVIGSFTTFSALSVSVVTMTASGAGGAALLYVAASLVLGIGAAAVGISAGVARTRRLPGPDGGGA